MQRRFGGCTVVPGGASAGTCWCIWHKMVDKAAASGINPATQGCAAMRTKWRRSLGFVDNLICFLLCVGSVIFCSWNFIAKTCPHNTNHTDAIGIRGHIHAMRWRNSSLQLGKKMVELSNIVTNHLGKLGYCNGFVAKQHRKSYGHSSLWHNGCYRTAMVSNALLLG